MLNSPFGYPYGYAYEERVNIYNDPHTVLLRNVRAVNNIWRYLRDGYLGKYFPHFVRQFYLQYDYLAIGFDSEEEFSYRLAAKLENVETEYVGRLNMENLIKNPLVSRILQDDGYNLQSERTKRYDTHNNITDNVQINQEAMLGVNANSNETNENMARQSASDERGQKLSQSEDMGDFSQTHHTLSRYSDSPQGTELGNSLMPVGWEGTLGAVGTATKNDHYPKAESLVPMPWNEGYLSTSTLDNEALDNHTTEGHESKDETLSQERGSEEEARERASFGAGITRQNNQGAAREQTQGYYDNQAATILTHDNETSRQLIGLEGRTVYSVWAEAQEMQKYKNAIGDLCNELRPCFMLVA